MEDMMKNVDILYFSSDEWGGSLKTSQYHIAVRLARNNRVLYINSIGLRKPRASKSDLFKVKNKLKSWCRGLKQINSNLFVITPIVIPFHNSKIARKINRLLLILYLKYFIKELKFKSPIIWTFLPNVVDILGYIGEQKVVYYCADQLSSFKGVSVNSILDMETKLIKKSDIIFATSQTLYDEKRQFNKNTFYMPHGVDFELFSKALTKELKVPEDIRQMKKPVIGFFGLISRDWIDFELLKFMAELHPEWSIVLIGKYEEDIPDMKNWKNIFYIGPRDYEILPAYSKFFDVAIIPFVISELTKNSNPLKMKEYLAAGIPVVSVKLPEVDKLKHVVNVADNYKQFVKYIEDELQKNSVELMLQRSNFIKNESWEARFNEITNIMLRL